MKYFLFVFFLFIASISSAQQADIVDFRTAKAELSFDVAKKMVHGKISYTFKILKDTDSIFLDAKKFESLEFRLNDQPIDTIYDGRYIVSKNNFKKGSEHQLQINWTVIPKKALYFLGWDNEARNQIWTQGQGKYTSNWMPSLDDMNDKIEFDLAITFDKSYGVIANGKLVEKKSVNDTNIEWRYDMRKPMSSYLVALAIGKYNKKTETSKSGIPLEMYYYPEDSLKFEPTYRYTKQMFDFLEEEIGVPYPWQDYKQVPVYDFLYAGMENTSLTIFADTFVTDSIGFTDKNYVNVNAHELAHQWFGNLVTETSGTHHWLHEGFATYYALLAEKEIFGEDYYYWRLYDYAQQLLDQDKAGVSTSLLNPKSSSLTFYQKGAWALHMLRAKVGDEAFKDAVKNYLQKHQFKNVDTYDFIKEVEKASGKDLGAFNEKWLQSKKLSYEEMEVHLYQTSTLIKGYLQVDCMNKNKCRDVFSSAANKYIKIKAVEQLKDKISHDAFLAKDVEVRQAIAQNIAKVPKKLKSEYESLLNDKSYATIEAALYNLWINFPEDRSKYLEQTKDIDGFSDKNIRLLWLALNLVTPDFQVDEKKNVYEELVHYTSDTYNFEIRIKAFNYLNSINACNDVCIDNLKQATTHHNWQLQKFAKTLLKQE